MIVYKKNPLFCGKVFKYNTSAKKRYMVNYYKHMFIFLHYSISIKSYRKFLKSFAISYVNNI